MPFTNYDILIVSTAFALAFGICLYIIPEIIAFAKQRNIMDIPSERSAHVKPTPLLGGIGIFLATIFSVIIVIPSQFLAELKSILVASIIIFLVGLKDDLKPFLVWFKFIAQCGVMYILLLYADLLIPMLPAYPFINFILNAAIGIFIINAYNFIDGVNGLSAGLALIMSLFLGVNFLLFTNTAFSTFSFCFAGSLCAFLIYNWNQAKVFMGDTGSLFVGTMTVVLTFKFLSLKGHAIGVNNYILITTLILLPIVDAFRVIMLRISQRKSPFTADKQHIHHLFLAKGYSHQWVSLMLISFQLSLVLLYFLFFEMLSLSILTYIIVIATAIFLLYFTTQFKKAMD